MGMEPERDDKETKKEIQTNLIKDNINKKIDEEEFFSVFKLISPGTNFRAGIDGALRSGRGALIVIQNDILFPLLDGGFRVNCRFTPQRLIELCKMDGAIVISKDLKKINYANVLLIPDINIKTSETGARHKAAERTAKQINGIVIAISERKHEITLFYKNIKHHIKGTDEILRKVNEHIQMLEKQRELFDININKLTKLELKNSFNLNQAMAVIQKGRIIEKISSDLKKYVVELGIEGSLLKTRLKELLVGVEKEVLFVLKDYTRQNLKKSRIILNMLTLDEIIDSNNILKCLAYEKPGQYPLKGWRILSKTSLNDADIAVLIKNYGILMNILKANSDEFASLIGEEKARILKEELDGIKVN